MATCTGFNADTLVICDKARPPPNLDGGLIGTWLMVQRWIVIDTEVIIALPLTGTAFNRLTVTLQSTIACQTKLASQHYTFPEILSAY